MEEERAIKKKQDELSIAEVARSMQTWWSYLLSKWLIIGTAGMIGALAGVTYATLKKPLYTADYTFVLESEGGSSLGGYAGLASMIGIDVNTMNGANPLFQGENIFDLYRSRRMILKTLLMKEEFIPGKRELIIDRYIAAQHLREAWKENPVLANIRFDIPQNKFTVVHDSLINGIVDEINKSELGVEKPDKRLSTIKVSMESGDPLFARLFVIRLVENVNAFYVQTKTKKTVEAIASLQFKTDSIRQVLNRSLGRTASALDANPNPNMVLRSLQVPSQISEVQARATGAIYEEYLKSLELNKISLSKETPLIQEIDSPVLPLKKNKPGRLVSLVEFGLLFAFMAALLLAIYKIWQDEIRTVKIA